MKRCVSGSPNRLEKWRSASEIARNGVTTACNFDSRSSAKFTTGQTVEVAGGKKMCFSYSPLEKWKKSRKEASNGITKPRNPCGRSLQKLAEGTAYG